MAKDLCVYNVSFNCGRQLIEPEPFGHHLFDGWKGTELPHLIVVNLQEIALLGYAFTADSLVKPHFDRFRKAVQIATKRFDKEHGGDVEYFNTISRKCGLTAIMIFVRDDFTDQVKHLSVAEVGVGQSEMGNKGAVGVRVSWKLPSSDSEAMVTTFVSAHLAPFEAQIERRNQDYKDIVRGLVFTNEDAREWRGSPSRGENVPLLKGSGEAGISKRVHGIYSSDSHLIFSGDLNYRTAISTPSATDPSFFPQPCSSSADQRHFSHLLEKDQLSLERDAGRTLHGLFEQPIKFPPTYKYRNNRDKSVVLDSEMNQWEWAQHRWPSWCDRILYSQTDVDSTRMMAGDYYELPLFGTSDHRPVTLSCKIPLRPVNDEALASQAPANINQRWQEDREAAKTKEFVVGVGAYLILTTEGRIFLVAALGVILGGLWLTGSLR